MRQQTRNRLTTFGTVMVVVLSLSIAGCGGGGSGSDTFGSLPASATAQAKQVASNIPPVAVAGPSQAVKVGANVTLDGSGSYDPDHNTMLAFSWQMVSRPSGSVATLSGPGGPAPSFVVDCRGTYVISLVVKDSDGLESEPATTVVSTTNTPPVAEAGPDQLARQVGQAIYLEGSASYDPDGDALLYQWEIIARPLDSRVSLSSVRSSATEFMPDVQGDYSVRLTVTDSAGLSNSDTVHVGFSNTRPVANAGNNQTVSLGDIVYLSGTGSYDAEGDPLTFRWNIVSAPEGSGASITGANSSTASFTADTQGMFVISLAVNDGLQQSVASITITVTIHRSRAMDMLRTALDAINALGPEAFKNPNMKHALTNKLTAAIRLVDEGAYSDAVDKLRNDVLTKMDGCAATGSPDQNDWITDSAAQTQIYPLVLGALQQLS